MKKKLVPCIIFIVIAVSITTVIFMLFGQNGNTADVNRVVGTSDCMIKNRSTKPLMQ